MTLATGVLLTMMLVAVVTDIRWHKIYNWNTYSGILIAIALNTLGWLLEPAVGTTDAQREAALRYEVWTGRIGWIGLEDCLAGLAACGFCMLVCFVFFRIGGGDVKLIAMQGAFLGLHAGIEAMLWTFVIGGAAGLVLLIWRVGWWTLLKRAVRQVLWSLRLARWAQLSEEERRQLQMPLFLAPSALLAVVIVSFDLAERWL